MGATDEEEDERKKGEGEGGLLPRVPIGASQHHQAHVGVLEGEKTRPVWQETKSAFVGFLSVVVNSPLARAPWFLDLI